MLFNSYEFILGFLPLTLAGFYALGSVARRLALYWLILTSLLFYAWWRPLNVLLIAPSIAINFLLARILQRLAVDGQHRAGGKLVLLLGIAFNVAFLGYFKYKNFFAGTINDTFGTTLLLTPVLMPLGISFITFQKIAFLVDVYGRRIDSFSLRDYSLFVLFFPQLIAGPIVHFREMMPQFRTVTCRFNLADAGVGLTLFIFGLFKKVVLADGISPIVSSIYDRAVTGGDISFFPGWTAAIGFTLQIYFDFSGYSDMALGLGRFFGVRLPANFNSPLRSTSIIDFWLRWHMTLTRFLTGYLFNPLVLLLTRRRLAQGRTSFSGHNTTAGAFATLLMFPILVTMLVSGFWHGAGYMFIVWGGVHGIYLTINHAWRLMGPRLWKDRDHYLKVMNPIGFVLTFLAVTTAMVFFRSASMKSAVEILSGMIGLNGVSLPAAFQNHFGPLAGWLRGIGMGVESWWSVAEFVHAAKWMALLTFIALMCPNTTQILAKHEPAPGVKPDPVSDALGSRALQWNASLAWAAVTATIAVVAIMRLGGHSEFLYWQF